MPTLSDIYLSKLRTAISELRTLLAQIPPDQSAPILAKLAKMEQILHDQKPPT